MKRMFVLLFLFTYLTTTFAAALPSGQEILAKVDQYRGYKRNFKMDIEVINMKNNKRKNFLAMTAYIRDPESCYLRYTNPPLEKDKMLLMAGKNTWFYNKSIRKPIRLSAKQRLFGNVSNMDVARANFSIDYTPNPKVQIDPTNHYLILELSAKSDTIAYNRILLWVDADNCQPKKAEFYTSSGKKLKSADYLSFQKVEDQIKIKKVLITDALDPNNQSAIQYSNYHRIKLPDHYFNADYLPRLK